MHSADGVQARLMRHPDVSLNINVERFGGSAEDFQVGDRRPGCEDLIVRIPCSNGF
jgi:hypothetical protein